MLLNRRIEIFVGTLRIGRTCFFVFHRSIRVDSLPRNLCPTLDDAIAHCIPHIRACTRFIAHKHRNRRLLSFPCRGTSRIRSHADAPPTRLDRVDYRKLFCRVVSAGGRGSILHEGSSTRFRRRRFDSKATATVFTLFTLLSYSHRRQSSSTLPSRIVHTHTR